MVFSAQEESLISVVRAALLQEEAGKVLNWARQLADLADGARSNGPIPGLRRSRRCDSGCCATLRRSGTGRPLKPNPQPRDVSHLEDSAQNPFKSKYSIN